MLPANTSVATATTTPVAAATIVALVGTAVDPRPGSSPNRTPVVTDSGAPLDASHRPTNECPGAIADALTRALRHAIGAARATTNTIVSATPSPRTTASTWKPGSGSMRRPGPAGAVGESSQATTPPRTAPAVATPAMRSRAAAKRSRRVVPSAASTAPSMASSCSRREIAWPISRRPNSGGDQTEREERHRSWADGPLELRTRGFERLVDDELVGHQHVNRGAERLQPRSGR